MSEMRNEAGEPSELNEPKAPSWYGWQVKLFIWWERDKIMEWFRTLLPGYKTSIIVSVGVVLGLVCPLSWTVNHGIDCTWIDGILTTLGFSAIAAVRAKVPVASSGKTTAAVLAALAMQVVSAFHGFDAASAFLGAHGIMVTPDAAKADLLQVLTLLGLYGVGDSIKRYVEAAEGVPMEVIEASGPTVGPAAG